MKKSAMICFFAIPLLIHAQVNITYDAFWQDKSFDWIANGIAFNTFQGNMYGVAYRKYTINAVLPKQVAGYPTVYMKNVKTGNMDPYPFGSYNSSTFAFGYHGESTATDAPQILGNVMFFQFNGRLWYFQQTNPKLYTATGPRITDNYECFQQMPLDAASDGFRFYLHFTDWPDVVKKGAFQADSNTLIFIGHNENTQSQYYNRWYLWVYSFDPATSRFSRGNSYLLEGAMGTKFGGVVKHREKSGDAWYVFSTSNPDAYIGYLTRNPNPGIPFLYRRETNIPALPNYGTTLVMAGSIEGGRKNTQVGSPQNSCRLAEFAISNVKSSDGNYHLSYRDFYVKSGTVYLATQGDVVLPTASYPRQVGGDFFLQGAYSLYPSSYMSQAQAYDGLYQVLWVYYPDKNQVLNGIGFTSDIWRPVKGSVIENADLMNDTLYPGIRNLWSLVGIVDGAPPCSVDWPLWVNSHSAETEPTELNFTTEQESETEISNSYEDKYTFGEEINLGHSGEAFGASMNEEFSYSSSFKNLVSSGTTYTTSYTNTFGLDEEFQENGFYIWSVPNIKRFVYMKYAWWDNQFIYPDSSTLQFLFRVYGTSVIAEKRKLSGFPFYVENPNAPDLADWTAHKRTAISSSVNSLGLNPILNLSWTDGSHGSKGTYAISGDSVSTYESGTSYEAKICVTAKIPEIFKANISAGKEVTYTNETSVKTKFGQEIEASLSNLTAKSKGLNIEELNISTFWFRHEDGVKWWFYDSLGDQRPWYIAYIVDNVEKGAIIPLAPFDGQELKSSEMLFAWKAKGCEPEQYTFYITNIGRVTPSAVVYRQSTGKSATISVSDFKPEPGKTYYWTVRGTTGEHGTWSRPRAFTVPAKDTATTAGAGLKAILYPNPGTGEDIHVLLTSPVSGSVLLSLYEISGKLLYRKDAGSDPGFPASFTIPAGGLRSGIYIVDIRADSGSLLKKLVIQSE